jgi:hypothetical protein
MVAEGHPDRGRGFIVGYVIVLLGAALFVTSSFLPYYGFPGGGSVSFYAQLSVLQVIGTILVTTRRTGSHGRDAAGLGA